jgi:hypothetical protein
MRGTQNPRGCRRIRGTDSLIQDVARRRRRKITGKLARNVRGGLLQIAGNRAIESEPSNAAGLFLRSKYRYFCKQVVENRPFTLEFFKTI